MEKGLQFISKARMLLLTMACMMFAGLICVSTVSHASGDFTVPDGMKLTLRTDYTVAPGIVESKIITNTEYNKTPVESFVVTIDPSEKVKIVANYDHYYDHTNTAYWHQIPRWHMSRTTSQAARYAKATGENVVFATNGDYYNMSTGEPTGALVLNGTTYHGTSGNPYFAILNDGTPVIRQGGSEITDDVDQAVGGPFLLVWDGTFAPGITTENTDLMPRNSVGIKADGTLVFMVVDGRRSTSVGYTLYDQARMLISMGCEKALYLDGGGSATFATKREGSNALTIQNMPSDGAERAVASTITVISTATASGEIDHASLSPNNEVYTPFSGIQFEAVGVDSAGLSADLPEDVEWMLAGSSADMGIIDQNGVFTSNGMTGTVTINLKHNMNILGTTKIEIQKPDALGFANASMSMGFSEESNLGFQPTYQNRVVNYDEDDFDWVLSDSSMGSFSGNIFTSNDSISVSGTVTVTYKNDTAIQGTLQLEIGKRPFVVADFEEDSINPKFDNIGRVTFNANGGQIAAWESGSAADCYLITGHYCSDASTPENALATTRGGVESAELVDLDSGEPVRFGSSSLKLNYDFTNANGIEGACVGFSEEQIITGSPKALGMWVYVPEGTANFWLRIRVKDSTDAVKTLDFTERCDLATDGTSGGLNWVGWKYVECDLSEVSAPFKLLAGETIRLMFTNGAYGGMGTKTAGSIYIDNLQFVYGVNVDDTEEPVIDTLQANEVDITDGMEITNNKITFTSTYHDVENTNMAGLDFDLTRIYIDGVNMTNSSAFIQDNGWQKLFLYDIYLANGPHSVKVLIRDQFGNETTQTKFFVVNGQEDFTGINVTHDTEKAILGENFDLYFTTNHLENVSGFSAVLNIPVEFSTSELILPTGYTGTKSYNTKTETLTLEVAAPEPLTDKGAGVLATLRFAIPADIPEGSGLNYSLSTATITFTESYAANKGDTYAASFSVLPQSVEIAAPYIISTDLLVTGLDGNIYVKDLEGNPTAGISVYTSTDVLIGITDENGIVSAESLCLNTDTFQIYAKDAENAVSFVLKGQSYAPDGAENGVPSHILTNGVKDGTTMKNLSWITNPVATKDSAVIRYAKEESTPAETITWQILNADSEIFAFTGSAQAADNKALRINSGILTGLTPDTSYLYQVGDGTVWSDVRTFRTGKKDSKTSFFVIGDTQAEDPANLERIIEGVSASPLNYDFGIQTGDSIENASIYSDWDRLLRVFDNGKLTAGDFLHVVGNHETFGDTEAKAANLIYNLESEQGGAYYSVEYDNVYVAVINYTESKEQLQADLDWLKEDAGKSSAKWKILSLHQPPYYTNTSGGNSVIHDMVPTAVEEAGIDFVFSGHDHSYARTEPLTGGSVDADNGVVYYICGSTGEKSYSITDNADFHFAKLSADFDALYLSVTATEDSCTVSACESDGTVIDSYEKVKLNTQEAENLLLVAQEILLDGTDPALLQPYEAACNEVRAVIAQAEAFEGSQAEIDTAVKNLDTQIRAMISSEADRLMASIVWDDYTTESGTLGKEKILELKTETETMDLTVNGVETYRHNLSTISSLLIEKEDPEPETEPETETETETEPGTEPETEPGTEPETEPGTEPVKEPLVPAKNITFHWNGGAGNKIYLRKGTSRTLKAVVLPSDTTDTLKWSTDKKSVAVVSSKGVVKAKGTGKCKITATLSSGITKSVTIIVSSKKTEVKKLSTVKRITLKRGTGKYLTVKAKPAKATVSFSYKSTNPKVAAVNTFGYVQARKKGKCTIKVKASSKVSVRISVIIK